MHSLLNARFSVHVQTLLSMIVTLSRCVVILRPDMYNILILSSLAHIAYNDTFPKKMILNNDFN